MKKSILALGALAVVGGLGLAGSAQAVVALAVGGITTTNTDPATTTNAGKFELNPGGTGHDLIVPYYSAQAGTYTLFTVVNTDAVNGKAVKVRFRGAANSDDVLDFTVFMSPSDVWTAAVIQGASGKAQLVSNDNSCTIPAREGKPQLVGDFITNRFPGYMSAEDKAANTREGYIEILNMADIPQRVWNKANQTVSVKNALYTAIKHVGGKPPCAATWNTNGNSTNDDVDAIDAVTDTQWRIDGRLLSADYGLHSPTGGLQGGWIIINQTNLAQFSGNDTAVKAYTIDANGNAIANAITDVLFSPQNDLKFGGDARRYTADPLLTGSKYHDAYATPLATTLNYDLPDLSTPMAGVAALATPSIQARALAASLSHFGEITNEFINDPNGVKGVPMSTDWVLSQVTRRYFAVVNYADSAASSTIVYNDACTSDGEPACVNGGINKLSLPYAGSSRPANFAGTPDRHGGTGVLWLDKGHAYGPQACLSQITPAFTDREEFKASVTGTWSPGTTSAPTLCGEVATMRWGNSPLQASITSTDASAAYSYTEGWGTIVFSAGTDGGMYPPGTTGMPVLGGVQPVAHLPIAGFAAQLGVNGASKQGFGATFPHRWQ